VHRPFEKESAEVALVNTVEENSKLFTERQVSRAKKARDLYHAIGTPSLHDFKAAIRMNMIKDNPVTIQDVTITEKIFGPDIGALKGKMTCRKPAPVVDDQIDIPKELVDTQYTVVLCIDSMKVNGLYFLATISKELFYRTAQHLGGQSSEVYLEALRNVFRIYHAGGFRVHEIRCNNEFRPFMEPLADDGIYINYANPQEHVPEAKRNIRVIKERVRAMFHRLPYKMLPKLLVKALVSKAAKKLNFFPAKGGISPYYSPRMLVDQRALDYSKHCKYSTGAYILAHNEPNPSNTQVSRALDCIYLRYSDSHQGGHELLHLPTNQRITHRYVTPIPITPAILRQVEAIARDEKMPSGLKVANRTGRIRYDSAWIAGVDYADDEFEEEFEDETFLPQGEDKDEESDDEWDNEEYDEMDPEEIYRLAPLEEGVEAEDFQNEDDPGEIDSETKDQGHQEDDNNEDAPDDGDDALPAGVPEGATVT